MKNHIEGSSYTASAEIYQICTQCLNIICIFIAHFRLYGKKFLLYYKDRKCAVNENPSVRIELARSKTSNNGPLRNGSVVSIARLCVGSKIVYFYESDHAFKIIWRRPCSFHLIKIKACFLKPDRPIFIIVIYTSCSGVCYRIYARQKFFNNALAPNGALALFGIFAGRISCNKRPHTRYLLLH